MAPLPSSTKEDSFSKTLQYLYSKLPIYQRIGRGAFKKDLTNIKKLCSFLGNVHREFSSMHIAGTNGKGSTAHILSAIYQNNGYKVGLYTSPHLIDFRERIKINGELVDKNYIVEITQKLKPIINKIEPSFFEITVAIAFSYFASKKVDIAIIETGLGGRLDSTNIIDPLVSIITTIDYDHMDLLGNTLEEIAFEKAGIIKMNRPLVLGEESKQLKAIFDKIALQNNAPIFYADNGNYQTDLFGDIQQKNIGLGLKAVELAQNSLPTKHIKNIEALKQVKKLSNIQGRFQIAAEKPLTILDVGHNAQAFKLNLKEIQKLTYKKLFFILGFIVGKDLKNILNQFNDVVAEFHFTEPKIMRKLPIDQLIKELNLNFNKNFQIHENVNVAYNYIQKKATKDDLIFVGGSTFVVSDFLSSNHAH